MMAHLPEGGATRVATKDDLIELEERLAARLDRCALKDDLATFATKDDLTAFATKEEFSELRTDVRTLAREVADLRRDVTTALVQGEALRAEWRQDLLTYVGRQTLIQVGSILTIVVAAMVFAASLTP